MDYTFTHEAETTTSLLIRSDFTNKSLLITSTHTQKKKKKEKKKRHLNGNIKLSYLAQKESCQAETTVPSLCSKVWFLLKKYPF